MRILELCHYYLPHTGGVEYHVDSLSKLLRNEGNDVEIWSTEVPESKAGRTFRSVLTPMANPITPGMIPALRSSNFDIVHSHVHYSFASLSAALTKKTPLVLTCHGTTLNYKQPRKTIESIFNLTIGRYVFSKADMVVTLSGKQKETVIKLGAKRVRVVPSWVDVSSMKPKDPTTFREKTNPVNLPVVLFVGRLLPVKGLEYLIKAVKKLPVVLWIVGNEAPGYVGYESTLKSIAGDNVVFFGRIPREYLADIYLSSDIFCLPSLGEGAPLTLLEGMAFSRCCLTTEEEIVEHLKTGYVVEPKSSESLRKAITELLGNNSLRLSLGARAYERINQVYTVSQATKVYTSLFKELIDG